MTDLHGKGQHAMLNGVCGQIGQIHATFGVA